MDPAVDAHGELTSQNVLFKNETVAQAAQALGVSEDGGFELRWLTGSEIAWFMTKS